MTAQQSKTQLSQLSEIPAKGRSQAQNMLKPISQLKWLQKDWYIVIYFKFSGTITSEHLSILHILTLEIRLRGGSIPISVLVMIKNKKKPWM